LETVVRNLLANLFSIGVSIAKMYPKARTYGFMKSGNSFKTLAPKNTSMVNFMLISKNSAFRQSGRPMKALLAVLHTIFMNVSSLAGNQSSVVAGM
jgi:hypothetical protein